jgi:transposase
VVEAAWSYRLRPASGRGCANASRGSGRDQGDCLESANPALHKRYARLAAAGKDKRKIVTAVGRELLGFIWAIGSRPKRQAANSGLTKSQQQKAKTFQRMKKQKPIHR